MSGIIGAIKAGKREHVRELIAEDPSRARARDNTGVSALMLARYYDGPELVDLLRPSAGDLDVFEAAALGDTQRLAEVLDDEPDLVNGYAPDGFTPLQLASFFGQPEAVRVLLERGAEVGATAKNPMRVQALHSAVAGGETGVAGPVIARIARLLLDNGAEANARQEGGFTPVHAAAQRGDVELTQLLLERGADRSAATDDGRTPAHFATEGGHEELAARLRGH